MVKEYRSNMKRLGGRKLHHLISKCLPQELQIGRDAFFDLLRKWGCLVRKTRKYTRTTHSYHHYHKYKNLIIDFIPDAPGQLFVSDITYIEGPSEVFYYLSLITDAYSRKIVGWSISDSLSIKGPMEALGMALRQLPPHTNLIHHSDRGVQYCSHAYVNMLKEAPIQVNISMTENSDPRENAIAERVNGILKTEWINDMKFNSLQQAIADIQKIIDIYNTKRPHSSVEMLTPEQAHQQKGKLKRKWKSYYNKKKNEEKQNH